MHRVVPLKFVVATLMFGLTLFFVGQARASSRLVILETRAHPVPKGLIEALRIQLAGSAEVSEVTLPSAAVRLGEAERERREGTWLLWVEESGGEPVVRVLGGSSDSEPVTLSPALSDSPELERIVALKVGLLLERPSPRPEPETRRTILGAFAELRLSASNGGAPRLWLPSVGFAAGPRWARSNLAVRSARQLRAARGARRALARGPNRRERNVSRRWSARAAALVALGGGAIRGSRPGNPARSGHRERQAPGRGGADRADDNARPTDPLSRARKSGVVRERQRRALAHPGAVGAARYTHSGFRQNSR